MVDRLLLNPWVSRTGNASFLVGAVLLVARLASGWSPLLLIAVVLLALGLLLIGAPWLRRWRLDRQPFADVRITIGGQGFSAEPQGRVLSLLNVNVYNAEPHPVSLTFKLYERYPPDEHGDLTLPLEATMTPPEESNKIAMSFGQPPRVFHPLPTPLNVPPRQSVAGDFHFLRPTVYARWGEPEELVVRVLDHHSGKLEEIQTIGEFTPGRKK